MVPPLASRDDHAASPHALPPTMMVGVVPPKAVCKALPPVHAMVRVSVVPPCVGPVVGDRDVMVAGPGVGVGVGGGA